MKAFVFFLAGLALIVFFEFLYAMVHKVFGNVHAEKMMWGGAFWLMAYTLGFTSGIMNLFDPRVFGFTLPMTVLMFIHLLLCDTSNEPVSFKKGRLFSKNSGTQASTSSSGQEHGIHQRSAPFRDHEASSDEHDTPSND